MISQGASEINISCVINQEKAIEAINAIHEDLLAK
jgi:aspartokinase